MPGSAPNLGQTIRRGASWLLFASTSQQVLQFAVGIVLARLLVPADFGMVVTIHVFTGFVGMLTSGGMGQSLIRAKEVTPADFNTVFTIQMGIGVALCAAFMFLAPWIATYLEDPRYTDLFRVSALVFLLRPMALTRGVWLNREMLFKKRALISLVDAVLTGVSSIAMAAAGMGVWSLILSGLIGAASWNVLLRFVTPLRLRLRFDRAAARRHTAFGFKITTNEFLTYLRDQSVALILSKMAGPAAVGLYNKAESLARLPNRLITPPTGRVVFRAMSKVQDNLDQTKYMFYRTVTLLMAYIAPALVTLWWITEPFIEVLYGHKWLAASEPMKILILGAFFRPIRTPCGVVLAAQNRLSQEMICLVVALVVTIAGCLIGVRWGIVGAAWAIMVTGVYITVHYYILVYRTLPTSLRDLAIAIAPGAALAALVATVLAGLHFGLTASLKSTAPPIYLVAMGGAGALTFVLGLLFLPLDGLRTEAQRWRAAANQAWLAVRNAFS